MNLQSQTINIIERRKIKLIHEIEKTWNAIGKCSLSRKSYNASPNMIGIKIIINPSYMCNTRNIS